MIRMFQIVLFTIGFSFQLYAAQPWVGVWSFSECWDSLVPAVQNCKSYKITIIKRNNKHKILIDIDGYQSLERIQGEGKVYGNSFKILFIKTRAGHISPEYSLRDPLLELVRHDDVIQTKWEKLTPALNENLNPGEYFKHE